MQEIRKNGPIEFFPTPFRFPNFTVAVAGLCLLTDTAALGVHYAPQHLVSCFELYFEKILEKGYNSTDMQEIARL